MALSAFSSSFLRAVAFVLAATSVVFALPTSASHSNISDVYIVFSNHLDVGYTMNKNGSCAGAVVNEYFQKHFPKAIETSRNAREKGKFNYTWFTHSWLVSVYRRCTTTKINIDGPLHESDVTCPTDAELTAFEAAVKRGDITWHAFPFNAEPETLSPELFDAALNLTFAEDDYFGLPHKKTFSVRDVPGLTRAAIPALARRGVSAITVGENTQCAPVKVPPIFLWKDEASGTEAIALFHAGGYGRRRRRRRLVELQQPSCSSANDCACADSSSTLVYTDSNNRTIFKDTALKWDDGPGLHVKDGKVQGSRSEHCVDVPEAGAAICYAWKMDNTGPHSYWEAELIYDAVNLFYPHAANVVASNGFDDFMAKVMPHKASLPVVTAEIGDTWTYGLSADPLKVALYRAASREYGKCMANGGDSACVGKGKETNLRTFERLLMTVSEHTWGWNGGDIRRKSWSNDELKMSLQTDNQFSTAVRTWIEQRSFIYNAVGALPGGSALRVGIEGAFREIVEVTALEVVGGTPIQAGETTTCGGFTVGFAEDGSITTLREQATGNDFAADDAPLARLHYQNLDASEINTFGDEYIAGISSIWPIWPGLIAENLVKPNLKLPAINSNATLTSAVKSNHEEQIVLELAFSKQAHDERGAPASAQATLRCDAAKITYTLRLFNKTSCHAPETLWMSFRPPQLVAKGAGEKSRVELDKIGQTVEAGEADLCEGQGEKKMTCGVHLHGVGDRGVLVVSEGSKGLRLTSVDSCLVSVGDTSPLPTPLKKPDVQGGVHFALSGNLWNTNYPFWYPFVEEDRAGMIFRFEIEIE